MKNIKTYIIEKSKYFILTDDERTALSDFVGILCGELGEDDEIKDLQTKIKLSSNEMKQVSGLYDFLADNETYKNVNYNNLIDDIPLIKKIYQLAEKSDILGKQWDLIDAFEKITL